MTINKTRFQTIGIFIGLVVAFLCYSYYNYNNRSKALRLVEVFRTKERLTTINYFREMHFNVFDVLISDKSQTDFLEIDTNTIIKKDSNNYEVSFTNWKTPEDINSKFNYRVQRINDKLFITIKNIFWVTKNRDTLSTGNLKRTIFDIVNNYVKTKVKVTSN